MALLGQSVGMSALLLSTSGWSHPRPFTDLAELDAACAGPHALYIRYSDGPALDAASPSVDTESGLELPGLSVNPLVPEPWWSRQRIEWIARQVSQYRHLFDEDSSRFGWILTGRVVGRGPDCEPLLDQVVPIAPITRSVLNQAQTVYEVAFAARRGPTD